MTDQELIAEALRIGPELRSRGPGDLDRLAGWLLTELATRLAGHTAPDWDTVMEQRDVPRG